MPDGPVQRPRLPSPLEDQANREAGPPADEATPPPPANKRMRFNIRFLMLATLIVAIATAGYNGMNIGGERRVAAILFTLASPIVLLVVLNLVQRLTRRRR